MSVTTVDTRHGTFNKREFSNGNTLPYTGVPFGMNYFTVQNQRNTPWYFDPTLPIFQGLRLTHQPSPWMGEFSAVLFTPVAGEPLNLDVETIQTSYDIKQAVYQPHYLSLNLLRYQIEMKVAPTKRGLKLNLTGQKSENLGLIVTTDNESTIQVDNEKKQIRMKTPQKVNNDQSTLYFYNIVDFTDRAIENITVYTYDDLNRKQVLKEGDSPAVKAFYIEIESSNKDIAISLGTSFIGEEFADRNLQNEVLPYSFSEIIQQSEEQWNTLLSLIEVSDRNRKRVLEFNQYLYRLFLFPQTFYELDENNEPVHYDVYSESIKEGKFFTNNGYWDTHKTVYPLFSILLPDFYKEVLEGIMNFYEASSHLPKWLSPDERGLMPGTHVNAVIADAAVKGLIEEEDLKVFLDAMIKEATVEPDHPNFGRRGVKETKLYGYVTTDEIESVNQTQDNAYSDFCIRQVASILGETEQAEYFEKEALNYRHLFDSETGFLRGKDKEGHFIEPFDPEDWSREYTEGSPWVNSLAVFHNIDDYIQLFGGKEKFTEHLVNLANREPVFGVGNYQMEIHEISEMAVGGFGQIAISNQPSFHIPYLYNYVGKPEYTQLLVKQISEQSFATDIDGYPGDEDNGSMSGWYIFTQLGFYPVTPGTNEYVLGLPQFDEVIIHLPNGKEFVIRVKNRLPQNHFIQKKRLNGEDMDRLYLTHEEIVNGGIFEVSLGVLPKEQEFSKEQLPYSMNQDI